MRQRELLMLLCAAALASAGCGSKHIVRAAPPSVSTPPPEETPPAPPPPAPAPAETKTETAAGNSSSHAAARAGQTPRAAPAPGTARNCRTGAPETGAAADFAPTLRQGPRRGEEQYGFEHHDGGKERAACKRQAAQCRSERPRRENQRLPRPGPRSDSRRRLGSRAESGGESAHSFRRTREIVLMQQSPPLPLPAFADKIMM